MSVPLRQQISVAGYLLKQKVKGVKRYPLVLMLEPLFRCNLACAGCGKIDYPDEILDQRLSVDDCLQAIDDCGAPVVSIAGGEPLILANELDSANPNLSFEREFGRVIGLLDFFSRIIADKNGRTVTRFTQSVATAIFLPVGFIK